MVARFGYEPNADGAISLVRGVLPRLVDRWPDAQVRLVGRTVPRLEMLRDVPGVVVRGEVPDVGPELAAADVVAIPLRFGGGTRLKALEAFARRVPVVSTSVGIEGLDVEHGVHLLVADDPGEFAAACARLFEEPVLAAQLSERAHALWTQRYRYANVRAAVAAAVAAAVSRSGAVDGRVEAGPRPARDRNPDFPRGWGTV